MSIQSLFRLDKPAKKMLCGIVLIFLLLSVIKAGYYTVTYGGTDLRSISVAAKRLDSGTTAYFYRWSPGQPEKYIDPNVPLTTLSNAVTVAPGCLYLLSFFDSLSYFPLRILWSVIQYLFILFVLCYFIFQSGNSPEERGKMAVTGVLLFLCSPVWFLNIERGQVYTLFAFLFTVVYALFQSPRKWKNWLAGGLMALAVYCRPNFIFLVIPVALARNWRVLAGWGTTTVFLAIHAFLNRGLWKGYSAVVTEFSGIRPAASTVNRTLYKYPEVIEGVANLTKYKTDFVCGGIQPLDSLINPFLGLQTLYFYIVLFLLVTTGLVFCYRKQLTRGEPATVVLFGFLLYMMAEYIMPASRSAYNLVLWIFPVLLIIQQSRLSKTDWILLITGLCLINGIPFYLPFIHFAGEGLLVFILLRCLGSEKNQKNDAKYQSDGPHDQFIGVFF